MKQQGQNTRRQFAGFFSQRKQNDGELASVGSRQETQSTIGEAYKTEIKPTRVDNHSSDGILRCPLNDDGNCQVYGTPCQYSNRLNCADYHEYRRRR